MSRRMNHGALSIRSIASTSSTPATSALQSPNRSAYASAYPSGDEDDGLTTTKRKSFQFLSLPSELRTKIYSMIFADVPPVLDLDSTLFRLLSRNKLLALFGVSKQVHEESTHHFFSTHTLRIFPTESRYYKTKKPLMARLAAHHRASVTSLELRLGPGFTNPPRSWVINDPLGLSDCTSVRVLKIFVELDPSDVFFKGWRAGDGYYENFCARLLEGVLKDVPSIQVVEFDAYSSVHRNGNMVAGLGRVVAKYDKVVGWGPERGWQHESDLVWLDAILIHGAGKVKKNVAVFA